MLVAHEVRRRGTLVAAAYEARKRARAPYSGHPVGAALLCGGGVVVLGCNVESKAYPTTMCAERVAIYSAIAQGYGAFEALAVVTTDGAAPCGACRQVLVECGPDMTVLVAGGQGSGGEILQFALRELIPHAFETFVDNIAPEAGDQGETS